MIGFVPSAFSVATPTSSFTARKCTLHARPVARRSQATTMIIDPSTINTAMAILPEVTLAKSNMAVTFPAYLAIFLGTLIPCSFLIILYIQDASRKAGVKAGREEK